MHRIPILVLVAVLAGCAGAGDRGARDRDRELDRVREEQREQDHLCEVYAREGRRDPRCPYGSPPNTEPRVNLPPVLGPGR